MSPTLEQFIESEEWRGHEGLLVNGSFKATWDAYGGCWNIGPGLTQGITRNTVMTKEQIDKAFDKELIPIETAVRDAVKAPLTNNEFTVLVSFAYNVGLGNFRHSTLLRLLNLGKKEEVPNQLRLWVHARATGTKVIEGLVNRRNAEIRLWGMPDSGVPTVVQTLLSLPQADLAYPVPKGAVTLEMIMGDTTTTVDVPLSATTAVISQLGHKVSTLVQGTFLSFLTYVLANFDSVWDLAGLNSSTVSVYASIAVIALIEWYKHDWVNNSNTTTLAIVNSLEGKLKEINSRR